MVDIVDVEIEIMDLIEFDNINEIVKYSFEENGTVIVNIREVFSIFKSFWEPDSKNEDIDIFLNDLSNKLEIDAERLWLIFLHAHILSLVEMECWKRGIQYHFKTEMTAVQ